MTLPPEHAAFLAREHGAAMVTVGGDGIPKVARVGIALVDGRLWSSGTRDRVRTRRLRRDPRCTVFVFDRGFSWVALETTVAVLDGPEAPAQNLALFRVMQGRPEGPLSWFGGEIDEAAFLDAMRDEGRVVYDFDVERSYGLVS
ncbi:MAG: pyridoxamine 5'-phosphate oxidase family protein [Acidimicrobiales bacterium]